MALFTFTCQRCRTKRRITPNTGFKCTGCQTRYSIGPDGKIRSSYPPKNNLKFLRALCVRKTM